MKPEERKLLKMLSNNNVTFFIPPYQRNYEWDKEQCEVFFEDIVTTAKKNIKNERTEHFFGTVTYFQVDTAFDEPDQLVLIDGQQRITTTMLFLVALRDLIESDTVKSRIDSDYLKNDKASPDKTAYKIKLKQVETDWNTYRKIIMSEDLTPAEKNTAVFGNYNFFKNRLTSYAIEDDLYSLVKYGLDNFSVVTIELQPTVNNWENPQEIFESMNSLGKPLSLADLVRNYILLGLAPEEQERLYKNYWLFIEKNVPGKVSELIRDFMQAEKKRYYKNASPSNSKELYSEYKKDFGRTNAEDTLQKLKDYGVFYSYIVFGESCGDKKIDGKISDLRIANITTANSFVMAVIMAWKKEKLFTADDVYEILDALVIYAIRRRIIAITQAENKNLPLLSGKISELAKAKDKRRAMFLALSRFENALRLPNDIEIKRYMESMNFYNNRLARFILSSVEEKITKSRPDTDDTKLQIEHIMPQTLNDEWREVLSDDAEDMHQQYVNTIGNLTLIRHNQELGQKPFKEKKAIYENNTGLQIAKTKITCCEKWGKEEIISRGEWLIDYILSDVFPIPDDMRKTNNFSPKKSGMSFIELQLIGEMISFIPDRSITAKVVDDKEVYFEGQNWKLSPLTRELMTRRGEVNQSGAYQGSQYWEFDGIKLADVN